METNYKNRCYICGGILATLLLTIGVAAFSAVNCGWSLKDSAIVFSGIGVVFAGTLACFIYFFVMYWKHERNLSLPLYVSPTQQNVNSYRDTFW